MEAEYERIRRVLEEQFSAALDRRNLAAARFKAVRDEVSSPDGAPRIAHVSAEYSDALKAVTYAVQRIADFQIRGIIPHDLMPEELKKNAS